LSALNVGQTNFESVFSPQLSSVLAQFLTCDEIFNVLGATNKNFAQICRQLKHYKNMWVLKFIYEFESQANLSTISALKLVSDADKATEYFEQLVGKFPDLDKKDCAEPFTLFKFCIEKQRRFRKLLVRLLDVTKD